MRLRFADDVLIGGIVFCASLKEGIKIPVHVSSSLIVGILPLLAAVVRLPSKMR